MPNPIGFFIYSAMTGEPLPGVGATLAAFARRNVDGTIDQLTKPPVVDRSADVPGLYEFTIDPLYLRPGAKIIYRLDLTTASAARYEDGEVVASDVADQTAGTELVSDTEEICLDEGDQAPPFTFVLRNQDGVAVDLTAGLPVVTFSMWPAAGGTAVLDEEPVTIVTAATGTVRFDWPLEASAAAGSFLAKFSLTQNGVVSHHPVNRALVVRVLKVAP